MLKNLKVVNHRIRALISNKFTRTAASHIKNGDLTNYYTDGVYIYKDITDEEYDMAIKNGDNEPWMMKELGIEAEYVFN